MTNAPERVAPGVYRVDAIGFKSAINVLLLENDDGLTLVDTGVAGSVGRIKDAVASLGSGPGDLKRVFLTHQHDDHTGGLKGLLEWAPHAEVGATAHEADVISGRRGLDSPSNAFFRRMSRNARPPGMPVGKVLREGDLVSGFRLISTPGHTLGHASLLRDSDGLLFTADAFGCLPRKIRVGVRKAFCADPSLAKRSAQKLLAQDFATTVMSHGPVLQGERQGERQGEAPESGRALPVLGEAGEKPGTGDGPDPRGLSFRELRTSDLDLMHRWLNVPHVRRWWYAEGTSYAEIEEHYLPGIEGREATKLFLILHEDEPIGFIQWYRISVEDDEAYATLVDVEDSAGVDLFIGEAAHLYRDLGRHVIRRFLSEHLFSDPGVEACVIGPEPKNVAAIRAYEKAGFRFFKTIQVPGEPEPEYLMKLSRRELEGDGLG